MRCGHLRRRPTRSGTRRQRLRGRVPSHPRSSVSRSSTDTTTQVSRDVRFVRAVAERLAEPQHSGEVAEPLHRQGPRRLHGEPRAGKPRTISDDDVESGDRHDVGDEAGERDARSTRSRAEATGMSQSAISRIWRPSVSSRTWSAASSCHPTRCSWTRSTTSSLYLNPPDAAVVMCVDEKTQVQALERTAAIFPMIQGAPERQTHDYRATAPPTSTPPSTSPPGR